MIYTASSPLTVTSCFSSHSDIRQCEQKLNGSGFIQASVVTVEELVRDPTGILPGVLTAAVLKLGHGTPRGPGPGVKNTTKLCSKSQNCTVSFQSMNSSLRGTIWSQPRLKYGLIFTYCLHIHQIRLSNKWRMFPLNSFLSLPLDFNSLST